MAYARANTRATSRSLLRRLPQVRLPAGPDGDARKGDPPKWERDLERERLSSNSPPFYPQYGAGRRTRTSVVARKQGTRRLHTQVPSTGGKSLAGIALLRARHQTRPVASTWRHASHRSAVHDRALEHPRRPIGLLALGEYHTDLLGQKPVGERPIRQRLSLPAKRTGACHAESPAQPGDGLALTPGDQPVHAHRRSVSRTTKVTARFRGLVPARAPAPASVAAAAHRAPPWSLRHRAHPGRAALLAPPDPQRLVADAQLASDLTQPNGRSP